MIQALNGCMLVLLLTACVVVSDPASYAMASACMDPSFFSQATDVAASIVQWIAKMIRIRLSLLDHHGVSGYDHYLRNSHLSRCSLDRCHH